ncbi:unnamed protein product [Bursaphelenchus xylophilus]|uniref:(pine wood nematode) hypothetical protein n=1 Tax=Bursaphelenchus xylophilus TaxID=6326 RepID=A0A1I7SBZ7_BURXY|nr:unnamed protein product [Bursaphelenchus xylophilus]CAG9088984.1 unnamed protein product [Bursaphelenchus xylophilus]
MIRRYGVSLVYRLSARQWAGLIAAALLLYNWQIFYLQYKKTYSGTFSRDITVDRDKYGKLPVRVVVIQADYSHTSEYILPQSTLHCYCAFHNYTLVDINLARDAKYAQLCAGKDFMFRRHCVLSHYMAQHPEAKWILALDADMGVINPNRLLEEFLKTTNDVVFYDRLFNYEIMAGSFILRNTEFARNFLTTWSEYENKVPDSFHGTDNGALHKVLLDEFAPNASPGESTVCQNLWNTSKDYDDLFVFESCVRSILGFRNVLESKQGSVRILSSSSGYWARDGWQTENYWSDEDFILHGWQERRREFVDLFAWWISPFAVEDFPIEKCSNKHENPGKFWIYKAYTHQPVEYIRSILISTATASYNDHLLRLKKVGQVRSDFAKRLSL